jgi:hypothetical protein
MNRKQKVGLVFLRVLPQSHQAEQEHRRKNLPHVELLMREASLLGSVLRTVLIMG